MINTLITSLRIDLSSSINAFIYLLKTGIFKFIFKDFTYDNKILKNIATVITIIYQAVVKVIKKVMYYMIIYGLLNSFNYYSLNNFIFVVIILSFIGLFINNNLLNSSKKNYYSINLFGMDAKKYLLSGFHLNLLVSFILNNIILFVITKNILISIVISLIMTFTKVIGETINLKYFEKHNRYFISTTGTYFSIVLLFSSIIGICLYFKVIEINYYIYPLAGLLFIVSLLFYSYLLKNNNYKLIMKKVNTEKRVFDSNSVKYDRKSIVEINAKDKEISEKKLKGKHGYDLLNTCFFERHKSLLLRSAINYTIVLFVLFTILIVLMFFNIKGYTKFINIVINNKLAWIIIIMYFINRGSIVTQAMFYNCDHALLTYNFYRDPKVIVSLFKKRLKTVVKVNLIPAVMMAIGIVVLLFITGGTAHTINYISIFISVISLSCFFSVHYLVLYYLLQPYNAQMQMKGFSYSILQFITYYFCYLCKDIVLDSTYFAIFTIAITVIYIVIALKLVYDKAPQTFRLK